MSLCHLGKLFSSDSQNTQGGMPQSVERVREDNTRAVSGNLTGMEQLQRVHGRGKLEWLWVLLPTLPPCPHTLHIGESPSPYCPHKLFTQVSIQIWLLLKCSPKPHKPSVTHFPLPKENYNLSQNGHQEHKWPHMLVWMWRKGTNPCIVFGGKKWYRCLEIQSGVFSKEMEIKLPSDPSIRHLPYTQQTLYHPTEISAHLWLLLLRSQ